MDRLFRCLAGVVVATALFGFSTARASCVTECQAALTFPDCTKPDIPDYWPTGFSPLSFTASCEDCCAAPGGPVTCTPIEDLSGLALQTADGLDLGGAIQSAGMCGDKARYEWSSVTLDGGGTYRLVFGSTIVLAFEVHACWLDVDCGACMVCGAGDVCVEGSVAECTEDADCGAGRYCATDPISPCRNLCYGGSGCTIDADCGVCGVCEDGTCTGQASVECVDDYDCGAGETCVLDFFDECLNRCEVVGGCSSDFDCGTCEMCLDHACVEAGTHACSSDSDCGEGESCLADPQDACSTFCQGGTVCETDGDCGACETCVSGACESSGVVACTKDSDCDDGMYCKVDPKGACGNACVDDTACTSDADCGECQVCVSGECEGTGWIACTKDDDCGAGMACKVAEPACKSACVAKGATCTTDADCTGACEACAGGACAAVKDPVCTRDDDCLEGQHCVFDATDACRNRCEDPQQTVCTTDEDCPQCSVCESGECIGLGVVACTKDDDCGEGKVCRIDASDPCLNACQAVCTGDAECGACSLCVDGRCVAAPQGQCTVDTDCAQGQVCKVDAADACKNRCVDDPGAAVEPGADAVGGGDTGGKEPVAGDGSGKGCAAGAIPGGPGLFLGLLGLFAALSRRKLKGDKPL